MIDKHIIKDFSHWDEIDIGCTIYYNVVLRDKYKHLNTFGSEIDLCIDLCIDVSNGFIELINRDDETKSKVYEIDVLTFKEKV